jgi:uncharacterized membrane protein
VIELLYQTLARIGYTHPIHPPMAHIPVGMVIGAFIFGLVAWIFRHEQFTLSARHCISLALIGLVPTALLGYMDWQHRYTGALSFPIKMKIGLAVLLLFLLVIAATLGRRARVISVGILASYGLCLLNVTALGYFGGELIFGVGSPTQAAETKESRPSSEQFKKLCIACHPGGGNSFKAQLPLKSAPQLEDFKTFLAYIRNPKARDGSQTIMPPFPAERLSETQAREIYHYIVQVLQEP